MPFKGLLSGPAVCLWLVTGGEKKLSCHVRKTILPSFLTSGRSAHGGASGPTGGSPMKVTRCHFAAALIALMGCGGYGSEPTPSPSANTPVPSGGISVANNVFSPVDKTVAPGATVQWAWNSCTRGGAYEDETCVAHNVTFADGSASRTQDNGTYSRSFASSGSYEYQCTLHTGMAGKVTVQ